MALELVEGLLFLQNQLWYQLDAQDIAQFSLQPAMVKVHSVQAEDPFESTHVPKLAQLLYAFEDHTRAFLREDRTQDSSEASEQYYEVLCSHTYALECVADRFASMED